MLDALSGVNFDAKDFQWTVRRIEDCEPVESCVRILKREGLCGTSLK